LENKKVKIEEFQNARLAKKIFQHAVNDYNEKIRSSVSL
jgi:inorganic pyrophosphatase